MIRSLKRLSHERNGFSAVELLLGLAITAVIVSAVVPAARGWHEGGKFRATLKTATGLAEAVRHYRAATGSWPASWTDLSGRYLTTLLPTNPWGAGFALSATTSYAEITTTVPLSSPPGGSLPAIASLSPVPGGARLTVRVALPGEAVDLEFERKRLTGV